MIEGWQAKNLSFNLTFGIHYHKALETHSKLMAEGLDYEAALHEVVRRTLIASYGWVSEDPNKNRETLLRSVVWYLEEFKNSQTKTHILSNGKAAVELSFKMPLDYGPLGHSQPYVLSGHIDRIVDMGEETYVSDHKTTKITLSPFYFRQFEPDNQMSLYSVAAQVIFASPVKGVIIDGAQIMVGFTRFTRGMASRTPAQLEEWLYDLRIWLERAEACGRDQYWPMNDKACGMYGGCAFREVCSKSPDVRKNVLESNFVKRHWNPLENR